MLQNKGKEDDPFENDSEESNKIIASLQNMSIQTMTPSKQPYDPSLDISCLNNTSIVDDPQNIYKDDNVYLSTIYNSIIKLNKSFKKVLKNKFIPKNVLNDLYFKTESEKQIELEKLLKKKEIDKIQKTEIYVFLKNDFPCFYNEIMENFKSMNEIFQNYKKHFDNLLNFKSEISLRIKNFVVNYNSIFDSKLENENDSLYKLFEQIMDKFKFYKNEIEKYKQNIVKIKNDNDVNELKKEIEDKKRTIKQLQDENVSFSEAITKIDTSNIKLKKECVIISTEYKKLVEAIKQKNLIIEKQKRVIDVLQNSQKHFK